MRWTRARLLLLAIDLALVLVAWWSAFWLRFNLEIPEGFEQLAWMASPWCLLAYGASLSLARV